VAHGKGAVLSRLAGGGRARVAPSEDLEAMVNAWQEGSALVVLALAYLLVFWAEATHAA
jgi:hypothetical protein